MWSTNNRRLGRTLACVAAVLIAVSCTSGETSLGEPVADPVTTDDAATDVCALLSADEIERITAWEVSEGTDHSDPTRSGSRAVCSFSETNHAGAVQVQWAADRGTEEFDRARSEMEAAGMDGRDVEVVGATAAYDSPAHGIVGMLIDGSFVQVATIGPAVSNEQHLELAAVVAGNLR